LSQVNCRGLIRTRVYADTVDTYFFYGSTVRVLFFKQKTANEIGQ